MKRKRLRAVPDPPKSEPERPYVERLREHLQLRSRVRAYAEERGIDFDAAITELINKGLE